MAIGNHELTEYDRALDMHQNFAPAINGYYLSSNVNITYMDNQNNIVNVSIGERFAKFKTRKDVKFRVLTHSFTILMAEQGSTCNGFGRFVQLCGQCCKYQRTIGRRYGQRSLGSELELILVLRNETKPAQHY
ncbi:hypothetical protein L218DRAFT_134986 [Marasmius fiardii PR-910]|nr:hypothetical protein L218DRAFT_134986 [Marasmius fiardii PR-910]